MIFLRWWDEDPESMTDERLSDLLKKWETEFLPSLNETHCGDCTKVASPCVRCHTEDVIQDAKRLALAFQR